MLPLKSLKVFCDVVGRRSFSRGADENGMTQSGASQTINHLELHLGVELIDRSKRPFVLTAEGKAYYDGCRKLVQQYFSLEERVKALHAQVDGRVNIASIYSVGLSYMNDFVKEFQAEHPKAEVNVDYQHPDRVYELVEGDQADIGLVSFPKKSRTIQCIPWREEPMVVVSSPRHPLAARTSVAVKDLDGLRMVAFSDQLKIRQHIDKNLAMQGVRMNVSVEFDNSETIKRAIEINQELSILPAPTVQREVETRSLVAIPLQGIDLNRPVGIICRRGHKLGTTAQRFIELLERNSTLASGPGDNCSKQHPVADAPAQTLPMDGAAQTKKRA